MSALDNENGTTTREDLVAAFQAFFENLAIVERLSRARRRHEMEESRIGRMLERDRNDVDAEYRRQIASAQVENGEFANLADTVVQPTPEWRKKAITVPYTPRGEDGTVRSVKTIRRLIIPQITYLLSRGVIDDDLYSACRWYKDRFDASEVEPSAPVSSYGETVRGDTVYGHVPRTQWAAEARSDFRYARKFIPDDVLDLFDLVVLHDYTLMDASKIQRRGHRNVRASLRRGALCLFEGISHRLPIEKRWSNAAPGNEDR